MARAKLERRVRRRLSWSAVFANVIGAASVFGFLAFFLPFEVEQSSELILRSAVLGSLYLALTLWLGLVFGRRRSRARLAWIGQDRPPSDRERRFVLSQPRELAMISAVFWAGAAICFPLVNLELGGLAGVLAGAILLGGVTTSAISYLMTERIMRPVTALVLADEPPSSPSRPGVSVRLVMAWLVATGVPVLGIVALAVTSLSGATASETDVARTALFLAGVALLVGLPAVFLATRSVAEPLRSLRKGLARIESGDLEARVPVDDGSEIGLLQAGFNRMAEGLAERKRLADLFGRHVGADVAQRALDEGVKLGGEERFIAALFVDVIGSTRLAAERPPGEVVELLNRFFGIVVEVIDDHGGLVNKFEGDASLCVFGAPVARDAPAGDALASARELRRRLRAEVPELDEGIGVAAGTAVAGNIGAEERLEYTVIGDPVNEAARLCELAKEYGSHVLASEAAVEAAPEDERAHWRILDDEVTLRGRGRPTRLATPAD
jgi:adenylate cyclase